ncbi:MAG: patatin-like phospholipase family protein [Burkholderiales bacterium]
MRPHLPLLALALCALVLAGCASRPVNAPIAEVTPGKGYRFGTRQLQDRDTENLVIVAFSGGGTRAAAFSFGVLEALRDTEVTGPKGKSVRLLDEIDVITGVSGGSFTALAYGLYGDQLFANYEQQFLKRDVQGMLLAGVLSPSNWGALWSESWGRSEMASQIYDDILFKGATFRDLDKGNGPLVIASATDISTGSRLAFTQSDFDLICSDIDSVPLSRAAAASSAVPLVLSPVTFNNYGGNCGLRPPAWVRALTEDGAPKRPAGRALQRLREMQSFQDSANRPYIHLVDGGLSDNLGVRGILETLEELESARTNGRRTRLDGVKRIVVFVVNSLSIPRTDWDQHERPPNDIMILLKATGVPIDRYSYESVEILKDITLRWKLLRELRASGYVVGATGSLRDAIDTPDIDIYVVDVSFQGLQDRKEFDYLNDLPTSFVLPPEAVDRLRKAARTLLAESPEFARLLRDIGAKKVPAAAPAAATAQ